ncbi:hypothetical protein ACOMHN_002049 [Nucella lapillus]
MRDAPMEVGANFSGSSVVAVTAEGSGQQMTEFQSNLTSAMTELTNIGQSSFSVQHDSYDVTALTDDLSDVCKAEGDVCGADYLCQNNACFYRCELISCGTHGQCYVAQTGQGSEATCRCVSDDVYDYAGDTCEESHLKSLWVAVISGGVSGFVVLILIIVLTCVYCKRRSSRKPASDNSVSESRQSPYHHSYVAPMYRPGHDNQAYNHATGDVYLPPPTSKSDSDLYIRFMTDNHGERHPAHHQGHRNDLSSDRHDDNVSQPSRHHSHKDDARQRDEYEPRHTYFYPRMDERFFEAENAFPYPAQGADIQGRDGNRPEGGDYPRYLPRPRVKESSGAGEHRHGHGRSAGPQSVVRSLQQQSFRGVHHEK